MGSSLALICLVRSPLLFMTSLCIALVMHCPRYVLPSLCIAIVAAQRYAL